MQLPAKIVNCVYAKPLLITRIFKEVIKLEETNH